MKVKRVHKILRNTITLLQFNENWSLTISLERKSLKNKHLRTKCVERAMENYKYTPFLSYNICIVLNLKLCLIFSFNISQNQFAWGWSQFAVTHINS